MRTKRAYAISALHNFEKKVLVGMFHFSVVSIKIVYVNTVSENLYLHVGTITNEYWEPT